MLFLLKAVLLWVSIFGYCSFLKKYMHSAFSPIFTFSSIGVLLFFAGLLNIMEICVYIIALGGWVCLAIGKPWKKSFFTSNKESFIIFGLFSAVCCCFLFRLYNQIPTHYDCFSHWLTVIREMINTDRMPNFDSSLIMFQGYPTGSAGFAYFICKFLGNSRDDLVLFSQSILYAASITVFFAFIKRKDVLSVLIAIAGSLFCIVANSGENAAINDLLVDTLVSLISIGVVAIIIHYKQDLITGVLISLPLQMFLVAIKNSGILMIAINFALVIALAIASDYTAKRKISILNLARLGALTAGIPAILYYLWIRHVDYVFPNGSVSKHTASVENYMQTLSSKTPLQIREILVEFFKRFISWNNAWLILIIVSLILFIGWTVKRVSLKKNSRVEIFIFLGILGSYIVFMVILAAMYILSMPYSESIVLASYSRYENTILVYIIGSITIYCLSLTSLLSTFKKEKFIRLVLLLVLSSTLLLQTKNLQKLFVKTDVYEHSSRFDFEQIKSTYAVEEGKSYFIYGNRYQNDAGYHGFLTRYVFWSTNIFLCSPEKFIESKDNITQYDYLIIVDRDDQIHNFLSNYNVDTNKQVYNVKEVF